MCQQRPRPDARWFVSTEGGREPKWSAAGAELFYRSGDQMMAVDIRPEPTFSAGNPRLLFEGKFQPSPATRANHDVSSVGRRFVMVQQGARDSGAAQIHVVLN